jgi:hypothetical protein
MQFTNFKVELIAIPEPATGGLLAFAGIALLAGKRLLRRRF